MLILYLLCSILGRFGVAFLGLTFNLDDAPFYRPPLSIPDWGSKTLHRDNSVQKELDSVLDLATQRQNIDATRAALANSGVIGGIFQMAQIEKGLPWFVERTNSSLPYLNSPEATSFAMNISHFSNDNLTMEVLGDNTVSFKYRFQEYQGDTRGFSSAQPALLETSCQEFSQDVGNILTTSNTTLYVKYGSYRWISQLFLNQLENDYVPRNATIQMWLVGKSRGLSGSNGELGSGPELLPTDILYRIIPILPTRQ